MVMVPPVILVFDISVLSVTSAIEWREFSRVGNCYIPQTVYEEIKMVFDRSPDPDLERIAKAFNRFYTTSGWKVSDANAHHAALTGGSGQALTRRTRVSLAVGRCAYGMAQEFPNSLVVLVSKDHSLLQRLYEIPRFNLCGITGDSLLQWSRSGQRPIPVSQKFQQFRVAHGLQPAHPTPLSTFEQTGASARSIAPSLSPSAATAKPVKFRSLSLPSIAIEWFSEAKSLLFALAGLAIAAYLVWLLFNVTHWGDLLQRPSNPQSLLRVDKISHVRYLS
jgi:hypothetical protein